MKRNKKYKITNTTKSEVIGTKLTKKATIDWLVETFSKLDSQSHIKLANSIYGEDFEGKNFHEEMVSYVNMIAARERLPKLLKKTLIINENTYEIREDKE